MLTLPADFIPLLMAFAPLFSSAVFESAQILLVGSILTPGKRTVTAALRAMGLHQDRQFQRFHRVLNRASWSSLMASKVLLTLLLGAFVPSGPIVLAIDETLERRWGHKISARGIYRDAARSSKSFLVKASGLRWVSMMLLSQVPWSSRVWALPFLSVLAPSERYHQQRKKVHKKLTDWARQMIKQVRRWLPERKLVVVADGGYACLELLISVATMHNPVIMITPLRLDARLYAPASERTGKRGRPRVKGETLPNLSQVLKDERLLGQYQTQWQDVEIEQWYGQGKKKVQIASATAVWYHAGIPPLPIRWVLVRPHPDLKENERFETRALLCTDQQAQPEQILKWFLLRWEVEVTFQEVRTHLGVESQRQWTDKAIERTTPVLLGLYSLVTLMAERLGREKPLPIQQTAWYTKEHHTFTDILALVRKHLWQGVKVRENTYMSYLQPDIAEIQHAPLLQAERIIDLLCYAGAWWGKSS